MTWIKEALTDGEIDALRRAALATCSEDTRYPLWQGPEHLGGGECFNIASWLVGRLGGHVGAHHGHYVWLSPDERYSLDLTGEHARSSEYRLNSGYHRVEPVSTTRSQRFARRADRVFDHLPALIHLGLDLGAGDAFPAEEPQAADDSERFNNSWISPEQYWHDEPDPTTPAGLYQFVYAHGQLEVSPNHSHAELAGHAGIDPASHQGPFAAGHVSVTQGKATWEVQANVNLHAFLKILKDATKSYGWVWGGMTDAEGQPIIDAFGPKKSATIYHYVHLDDHLYLGHSSAANLVLALDSVPTDQVSTGTIRVFGSRAVVAAPPLPVLPALFDWAADFGLVLYGGNDNVIKTIPDLQEKDVYDPDPQAPDNPVERSAPDERLPTGLYRCPGCDRLFPNWHEYSKHRREPEECAEWADRDNPDVNGDNNDLPRSDPGLYGDGAHFTEMRQEPGITTGSIRSAIAILPARSWKEAARVDGFSGPEDALYYVAYRDGDPLAYMAVTPAGKIRSCHSAVEDPDLEGALLYKLGQHFHTLDSSTPREGWLRTSATNWRWSKDQAPKDLLEAPLPFIYDVDEDKIHIGHPGARTSDIPGKFTPGGIVEGTYEPGGKLVMRSITSVPFTVRHLCELFYYSLPTLEIKSVHLMDDAGRDTRLAAED